MTKKVDTWMPLLVDKYLGDTMLLTTEQHGAYLLLLMTMWKKDGRLPDNDQQLAQAAKLSPAKWKAARPVLIDGMLLRAEGGYVVQKRLSAELARSKAHTEAKAEAGSKGAAKRWQQGAGMDGNGNGTANGTAMADASQSHWQTGAHTPPPLLPTVEDSASSDELAPPRPVADGPQLSLVEGQSGRVSEPPPCPHLAILALWAEVLPALPQHKVEQWKGARADHLRARWREQAVQRKWASAGDGLAWFRRLFGYVGQSRFLTGQTGSSDSGKRPFVIELEWLVIPSNFAKVVEGKYHRDAA